jgi:hypothetical protein
MVPSLEPLINNIKIVCSASSPVIQVCDVLLRRNKALFSLWVKSFSVSHQMFHGMLEGVFAY